MKHRPRPEEQDDLLRPRLIDMIDGQHELVKLAALIDWEVFEREWSGFFPSGKGRPATEPRLVAGLLYLQHAYRLSDEAVVARWVENPYYQHFTGEVFFQHRPPIDPSSLTRWRGRIGEEGVEWLLTQTIRAGQKSGIINEDSVKRVAVDTTVMEKAIAHPTDARLYERARDQLVALAQEAGVELRQSYARLAPRLALQVGRYAHAKQFKRMRKALKKLKGYTGRVMRDLRRQLDDIPASILRDRIIAKLALVSQLLHQQPKGAEKIYALHEPEVDCISKGKARVRYEFGCKVSVTTTLDEGFVVGMRSFPGNPYDGHTLRPALEQLEILTDQRPDLAVVDRGYRGHGVAATRVLISGTRRGLTPKLIADLRRRSAIEAEIGHMKTDGRLSRCPLRGTVGDALFAVLCACGHNIRKILAHLRAWLAWIVTAMWAAENELQRRHHTIVAARTLCSGRTIEFKAVVSPDWLAEGEADPRDPENPRVRQLVAEAQAWAESWGGKGAVWAVRYATDEKGAGVVDLFMSPVRQQQHKTGKAKAVISCRKAKDELLEAERALDPDLKTSGAAMQSSWARRCGQRLDARIERGMSREMTGRNHVHADVYAREADRAHLEVYEDACREANQIIADAHAEARRATLEAEDASRSWMKAAKAAQRASEAATIALRAEMEAQRQAALEEHTRLMGLAGTPEFRPEADMEVFNNIERVVMDWRLLKAEKQAFRTERDAALDARTREVLAENVRLKEQVYRYDDHGEIKIRWWFSRSFRETVADSTHWAIMDRQTVFALRSKYSIQLLQHIASRTGQRFRNGERFSVHSLRAILAVPEGKLMRFADLNKYALKGKRWGGRPPAASMCHCGEC